jgi:hypothetical protein
MHTIASFDIGIKHLAFCILDIDASGHKIHKWVVTNVLESLEKNCQMTNKKHEVCGKTATVQANDKYCCMKKSCQKKFDEDYPISQYPRTKVKKNKAALKNPLFDLCMSIKTALDNHKDYLINCDIVVLENQPVLKNPTMKSIQMFIYSYCLLNGVKNIILFNANKKLNIYDGPEIDTKGKKDYALRKYLSIEYTKYFLTKNEFHEQLEYFKNHKKMDDLADCYLQGLTYHHSLLKKK